MEPVRGGNLVNLPEAAQKVFDDLRAETGSDCSNAGYALRFAAGFDGMEMVLSGMSNMEQMEDNLKTFSCCDGDFAPLSEREREAVDKVAEVFGSLGAIPCTQCRYCFEENHCPMEIKIPNLFSSYNNEILFGKNNPWSTYEAIIESGSGKPGDCIECGMCEGVCPQHLEIRELLKKVAGKFEA
jgi:predicted aldo/keto reductase-like oxidoreductase